MKGSLKLISVVFLSTSINGCVSAKQKLEEQQELERSIRRTSNPDAVKGCSFMMNLRPDGLHSTVEAQAASLVIPKRGVSWVVLDSPSGHALYSCSQQTSGDGQEAAALTPTPGETKAPTVRPTLVETKVMPTQPPPEVVTRARVETKVEGTEPTEKGAHKIRVTNNPEAVKGCKFLENFSEYQNVVRFQQAVVGTGGNLGYIVASNQEGEVIGESYLCSEETAR